MPHDDDNKHNDDNNTTWKAKQQFWEIFKSCQTWYQFTTIFLRNVGYVFKSIRVIRLCENTNFDRISDAHTKWNRLTRKFGTINNMNITETLFKRYLRRLFKICLFKTTKIKWRQNSHLPREVFNSLYQVGSSKQLNTENAMKRGCRRCRYCYLQYFYFLHVGQWKTLKKLLLLWSSVLIFPLCYVHMSKRIITRFTSNTTSITKSNPSD